eukprot:1158410-Pelagomonas_calceolata.AAC.7
MDLHNSNYDGVLNLCFDDDVSCCVNREVKARKFAVRCGARLAPPALPWCVDEGASGVWSADCLRGACKQ